MAAAWTRSGRARSAAGRRSARSRGSTPRRFHARQAALIDRERGPDGAELETLFARDAAVEALASCPDFGGARAGVAVGTTLAGNGALTEWLASRTGGAGALSRGDPGALSRDLAERHGARGPVSTVSVACASGAAAVGLAAEWIREGRATRVLAGGADAISPFVFSGFDALRALSTTVARPFDVARDGLTLGEGAGFLLLEEEDQARRRGAAILARVTGYGSGSDAHHMTRPDPEGRGLRRAVETALLQAGRAASDVDFVSAHGTGTTFNDAMEEAALAHVLGAKARLVPVNGIKGAIGHTLGAAGALEAVLSALVLARQRVPPTAGHASVAPGFAARGRLRRAAFAREADRRRAVDLVRIRGHERGPRPGARMRPVFLVSAALADEGEDGAPEDANRLRRMDRFGRTGFLAGTRAFAASGALVRREPDARYGVIVGTRHGCRPAITEHAARLAAAARVEDLAPSVFAATVHNSVNGELAMALGLGGVSETIVSGRTAGLEALILGARRVAARRRGPHARRRGRGRRRRDARGVGGGEICSRTQRGGCRAGRDGRGGAPRGQRKRLLRRRDSPRAMSPARFSSSRMRGGRRRVSSNG